MSPSLPNLPLPHCSRKRKGVSPVAQLGKKEVGREPSTQPGEAAQDREARQAGDGGAQGVPRPGNKEADGGCHGDEEEEEKEEGRGLRGKGERGDEGGERGQETRQHGCEETKQEVQESCLILHPNNLGEVRVHVCVCVCACVPSTLALSASCRTVLVAKETPSCQQMAKTCPLCCRWSRSHCSKQNNISGQLGVENHHGLTGRCLPVSCQVQQATAQLRRKNAGQQLLFLTSCYISLPSPWRRQ